jgi:phosphopantothenoylcysteine synthetase/decarboxylase
VAPLLILVVCAGSSARHTTELVARLGQAGWRVRVVARAEASMWLDHALLCQTTGFPPAVRMSDLDGSASEAPQVVLVAPATFNTVGHLASGQMNSLALSVVQEAIGRRTRTIVLPHVSRVLNASIIFQRGLSVLEHAGVHVVRDGSVCDGDCAAGAHLDTALQAAGPA